MSGPVVFALRAILAAGLYAFLAWAFLTLWRDLKSQATSLSTRKIPAITLTRQTPGQPPQTTQFQSALVTIGRGKTCEFLLPDDSISSNHARLTFHHGHWWLEDLGSTNGTYLNSDRLTVPTVVISGDEVRCGEIPLQVSLDETPTQVAHPARPRQ